MSKCTAPIQGHQGDTEAARACPVHGRGPIRQAGPAGPPPPSAPSQGRPAEPFVDLKYWDNGTLFSEQHFVGETLHNEEGPAWIAYGRAGGTVIAEIWMANGKKHRDGEPAAISYGGDGSVRSEEWCLDGVRQRPDGGPVATRYRPDGSVESESWLEGESGNERKVDYREDGGVARVSKLQNEPGRGATPGSDDSPAITTYREDGSVESEEYFPRGQPRPLSDTPAKINYRSDGSVESEEWREGDDGVGRRRVGPLSINHAEDGTTVESWEPRAAHLPVRLVRDPDGKITDSSWRHDLPSPIDDEKYAAEYQHQSDRAEAEGKRLLSDRPLSPERILGATRRLAG